MNQEPNVIVKENILDDEKYQYLFSVEVVNDMVLKGIPFRDAYKQVGEDIENGIYKPNKEVNHTHEGSIGNLCNDKIEGQLKNVLAGFKFDQVDTAIQKLLK